MKVQFHYTKNAYWCLNIAIEGNGSACKILVIYIEEVEVIIEVITTVFK